jgi:hypothetical protein
MQSNSRKLTDGFEKILKRSRKCGLNFHTSRVAEVGWRKTTWRSVSVDALLLSKLSTYRVNYAFGTTSFHQLHEAPDYRNDFGSRGTIG